MHLESRLFIVNSKFLHIVCVLECCYECNYQNQQKILKRDLFASQELSVAMDSKPSNDKAVRRESIFGFYLR